MDGLGQGLRRVQAQRAGRVCVGTRDRETRAQAGVSKRLVLRDWIECPITLRRGLTGAKPEAVCHWAFETVAARPDDTLDDLFPGTGAVAEAWRTWRLKFTLSGDPVAAPPRLNCTTAASSGSIAPLPLDRSEP